MQPHVHARWHMWFVRLAAVGVFLRLGRAERLRGSEEGMKRERKRGRRSGEGEEGEGGAAVCGDRLGEGRGEEERGRETPSLAPSLLVSCSNRAAV